MQYYTVYRQYKSMPPYTGYHIVSVALRIEFKILPVFTNALSGVVPRTFTPFVLVRNNRFVFCIKLFSITLTHFMVQLICIYVFVLGKEQSAPSYLKYFTNNYCITSSNITEQIKIDL